jgi:thiamine biosynthesis lipoprotein
MTPACASARRARPLLGTFVEVAASADAHPEVDAAIEAAFEALALVHRLMSFHERSSDVSRLNREAADRPVAVDPFTYRVLEASLELHRRSGGVFDVAVAPAMEMHGLLPPDVSAGRPAGTPAPASEAIELLPEGRARFRDRRIRIDLGGIAKGFAVDLALQTLRRRGIRQGLVNAGGDLAAFGPTAQTIHVRDPRDPSRLLCQVAVRDEALASTGGRFDPCRAACSRGLAVIDPRRGRPVDEIAGATVRASSCLIADALTKVVVIAGESAIALLDRYDASALYVSRAGDVRVTSTWRKAERRAA